MPTDLNHPMALERPGSDADGPALRHRVLVAGAGGASLGTEVVKSLVSVGCFDVVVADVSPLAFGLYMPGTAACVLLDEGRYLEDLVECCRQHRISVVVPGAEATLSLIVDARERLSALGVVCAINRTGVIDVCSDKSRTFTLLSDLGVRVPDTRTLFTSSDLADLPMPCVIKPATGSGGSTMVAAASSRSEALVHAQTIWAAGLAAIAQEYLPPDEGEFTVGVLSLPNWTASVAMRREFPSKLSYLAKDRRFLISSGYSQGLIDDFPVVRERAELIARLLGSLGPLNVQGRMHEGEFVPFEVNARFSATTYLRHMAGFGELSAFIEFLLHDRVPAGPPVVRPGFYLRSLSEVCVPMQQVLEHR